MILTLEGTPSQQNVSKSILARCTFPLDALIPGLQAATGRQTIPVQWSDLSHYGASTANSSAHQHDHDPDIHTVERRERVLGLAWTNGRIELDLSLEGNLELAGEVLLSELAHMVDFFLMSNEQRVAFWNLFHYKDSPAQLPPGAHIEDGKDFGHGHGWFDVGGYYSWAGEAFMGVLVKAYSNFPLTIAFDHSIDSAVVEGARKILSPYFGSAKGDSFHDSHVAVRRQRHWTTRDQALRERTPCRTCKP